MDFSSESPYLLSLNSATQTVTVTMNRDDNPKYNRWCSLSGSFTGSLQSDSEITITYSATDSMKILFPMSDLVESGSGHALLLPSTMGEQKTVTFRLDTLTQPSWVMEDTTEFDYTKVEQISFELASEDTTQTSGSITIFELGIDGYEKPVSFVKTVGNTTPTKLIMSSVSSSGISLGIPVTGTYEITIYGVNGRQLFSERYSLSVGFHQIPLQHRLSSGVKIVNVKNANHIVSRKIMF